MSKEVDRRGFIKTSVLASSAGVLASLEEKSLLAQGAANAAGPKPAGKEMPTGKIGDLKISRLIIGGNLISGFAHSRDLIYVSSLLNNYFTDEKVLDTLQIAEENGVNTAILREDDRCAKLLDRYWKERGGKLQWIAQCYPKEDDPVGSARKAIDRGAVAVYAHGGIGDSMVEKGRLDVLEKTVALVKQNGLPAGLAGHKLAVPMAVEKAGIGVDFYMKTLHHDEYWSATPKAERPEQGLPDHDNMWATDPTETIAFMKSVKKPWIAYKTLAAGAIHPQKGFEFAFQNGADFICVGMFDYQIVEDVIIARNAISKIKDRPRPWMA